MKWPILMKIRYEINKSSRDETCAGASFLMQTPPEGFLASATTHCKSPQSRWEQETLGAFLMDNLDHDQWSKITPIIMYQRNSWNYSEEEFIDSFLCNLIWVNTDHLSGMHP